jgi:hypothetical protein
VERASELGIIPATLQDPFVDLTQPITREEFAGIALLTYEVMAGRTVLPVLTNPFADTRDPYVLRAYNADLMVGVGGRNFGATQQLTREQAATVLTRVFRRVTIPGWTIATEGLHPLNFTMPPLFADDANISYWARESVYFMAANGVIVGVGNNQFAPRAVTTEEQARGFAIATREQALTIAMRMIDNL